MILLEKYMNQIDKKIAKAKLNLFTIPHTTFFSALLANLRLEVTEEIPTAATDGIRLLINPNFIKDMPLPELIGLLTHELLHCAYSHMERAKDNNFNTFVWNIAADYLINGELDKLGFQLPKERLLDHKYDGLGTKQIYDLLMEDAPPESDLHMPDLIFDNSEGMSKEERHEAIVTNIVKAVTQAKLSNDPGSVPGSVMRKVEEMLNPRLPWNVILQNYLSSYNKEEYSWSKPNKRYWPEFYLPTLRSNSLNQISVGVDVSGSIEQEDLDCFIAEIRYIWDIMQPKSLRIQAFDTKVRFDHTYNEGDAIEELSIMGGGGTSVHPLIDSIREDKPELSIIFSDMEFKMPYLQDVQSDIMWIRKGNFQFNPTKGVVIDYD